MRSSSPERALTLDELPAEILHRIAHFLQPQLPQTAHSASPPSSEWAPSATDLILFSCTSRAVWAAVRSLVGRHFGATASNSLGGLDIAHRLDSVSGDGESDGMPDTIAGEAPRRWSAEEREQRVKAADERDSPQLLVQPKFFVPGLRIRHFHLKSTETPYAIYNQSHIIARAIRSMPKLESFAFVHTTEDDVVARSPYACALFTSDILVALASRPKLRALFFCGAKLITAPALGPEQVPIPEFGAQLEELHLSAVHDSALQLIKRAKGLKQVHAWRDFARSPRIKLNEWWTDETWQSVEEVDVKGLGGTAGREMLEAWVKSLSTLRATPANPVIPLRSLRLFEPFHNVSFFSNVLPAFAGLPRLESLAFILWRDRNFSTDIFDKIAVHLPDLTELTLGMENEQLNWWPGSMSEYGASLAHLRKLEGLTWNFTPYADLTFDEVRPVVMGAVQNLTAHSPALRTIRWIGEECHLARESESAPWLWQGEPPAPLAPEPMLDSKDEEEEEVVDESDPARNESAADKENVDPVGKRRAEEMSDPFADDTASGSHSKRKGKARLAEVDDRVEESVGGGSAPGSSTSVRSRGSVTKRKEKQRGPRRSLFGELARSISSNSVSASASSDWDLQPIASRASTSRGTDSAERNEEGGGSVCEDDSGFFE